MIARIRLLHYLSESTYRKVCEKFGLDVSPSKIGDNDAAFAEGPITRVHPFNIAYEHFGRIWFMHVDIDFPRLGCGLEQFPGALLAAYEKFLGPEILSDFPAYDAINCDYVEYTAVLELPREAKISQLANDKCVPEQLDAALWSRYSKPHSTIAFYAGQADATHIRVMAKCHGTALKRFLKDPGVHRATGVMPAAAVSADTMQAVLQAQIQKHFLPHALDDARADYTK